MFQEFGLTYYEDKALRAIIRERMTVKEIIRKTGIPPGKVYSVLKALLKRGIITESTGRPKTFHVENPKKIISTLIEHKQNKDEESISNLRSILNTIPENSNSEYFLKIGTTPEDNKNIQLKMFQEAKKEVCQIFNSKHKPQMNRQNKDIWEDAILEAVNRGVKFRVIYHKDTKIPIKLSRLSKEKFEIRKTTQDLYRLDVVDNKKVMIKIVYDDPMMFGGIIFVENEKLARNLKIIFEDMWKEGF